MILKIGDILTIESNTTKENLQKFDIIIIKFNSYIIFEDYATEGIISLKNHLTRLLKNSLEVNSNLFDKSLGYFWNEYTNSIPDDGEINEDDITEKYSLWSTREFSTWIYSYNRNNYIEISPNYKWHFIEPIETEKFITYEEFIKDYRPIVKTCMKEDDIADMLQICNEIINKF